MGELKRKIIQYEVLTHESASEVMLVRITRQSDRKEHFGVNGTDEFVASNGLHLQSHCSPAVTEDIKEFGVFVRGEDHEDDDDVLVFRNREDFLMFKQAVREYNETDFGSIMQMTEATLLKAKGNLESHVYESLTTIEDLLRVLRDSETKTVEDFMRVKLSILLAFTEIPLSASNCPYCIHYGFVFGKSHVCGSCEYGKRKGICNEEGSVYDEIIKKRDALRSAIRKY